MSACETLQSLRAAQKKLLPAIQTATDLDIVLEIGCAQERRRPLGTNDLLAAGLGAPATVSRRLSRLRKLGVVRQRASLEDRRKRNFALSASLLQSVRKLVRVFRRALAR
jgi:DNA-binding MarR family transcriptional regulator